MPPVTGNMRKGRNRKQETKKTWIKRCPRCGRICDLRVFDWFYFEGKPLKFGSPIRVCAKCGNVFDDKDYRELALTKIKNGANPILRGPLLVAAILMIEYGIAAMIFFKPVFIGLFVSAAGILVIVSDVRGHKKREEYIAKQLEASVLRLLDPEYAAKLKRYGYEVPDLYLNPDYKYLLPDGEYKGEGPNGF